MAVLLTGLTTTGSCGIATLGYLKAWAERGLIHLEDMRTGRYKTLAVPSALRRIKAINDMLGNSRRDSFAQEGVVYKEHRDFVDRMVMICEEALVQGEPTDERALAERKRRQPATVLVPAIGGIL